MIATEASTASGPIACHSRSLKCSIGSGPCAAIPSCHGDHATRRILNDRAAYEARSGSARARTASSARRCTWPPAPSSRTGTTPTRSASRPPSADAALRIAARRAGSACPDRCTCCTPTRRTTEQPGRRGGLRLSSCTSLELHCAARTIGRCRSSRGRCTTPRLPRRAGSRAPGRPRRTDPRRPRRVEIATTVADALHALGGRGEDFTARRSMSVPSRHAHAHLAHARPRPRRHREQDRGNGSIHHRAPLQASFQLGQVPDDAPAGTRPTRHRIEHIAAPLRGQLRRPESR